MFFVIDNEVNSPERMEKFKHFLYIFNTVQIFIYLAVFFVDTYVSVF